jgi:quinohemoprotein ethanol dehydrogenase
MGWKSSYLALAAAAIAAVSCSEPAPTPEAEAGAAPADAARPADVDLARIAAADSEPGNWMTIGRTYDEAYYSPLDQINDSNVAELGLAWFHDLDTFRGVEATPLAIDGVLYLTSAWNITYAFDGATGELLWQYDPQVPREWGRYACCEPVSRGLAAWNGKIIVATLDGRLIALDAANGTPVWETQTFDDKDWPYSITGAPRVFDGKVLIGNGGADLGVRGYVGAYDAETGEFLWRFYTVPGDPALGFENEAMEMAAETWSGEWWTLGGGGTAWDAISYDPELNLVYIGTGNGSPLAWEYRSNGEGDNLFLASIVALDADTGEYRWHYQTAPQETWDYTATAPFILADLEIEGETRQVIMQAPKNGFFYVLDRATGELLSAEAFVPNTWASGIDLETGRPNLYPDAIPDETPYLMTPGPGGGHNWTPMSYNPETGLVYFAAQEQHFILGLAPDFEPRRLRPNAGLAFGGGGDPHAVQEMNEYAAANARGWLTAWDPVAQEERWRVPHSRLGMTGVMSTGGNLVFEGTPDQTFAAYRADTGEKLWEAPVQTTPIAAAMTYLVDGEQYVALAAGWGGGQAAVESRDETRNTQRASARLLVFKLGGTAELPALEPTELVISAPPPIRASEETIEQGRVVYAENCQLCHGPEARGSDRDLRLLSPEDHDQFNEILAGARLDLGMPSFEGMLDAEQIEAVHAYIIARANEDWLDISQADAASAAAAAATAPIPPAPQPQPQAPQ